MGGSLDTIAGWDPQALALTHYGQVDDVGRHLDAQRASLHAEVVLAARHGQEAFEAGIADRVHTHAADVAPQYLQAAPTDHLYLGLRRYLDKREPA